MPRFRGEAPFKAWLYRIAYNCAMDELRSRKRRAVPAEPVDRASPATDPGERAADRDAVHAALMTLSPENRAAVLLVDWQDLDYADAAKVLGVRPGTLASRLSRARPLLRAALAEGARAHD
ncbi:RNA polymerase sigma factor [Actinokineospora soli]|uniref:RNA polymerase sigma factor n=1 Tax=Actinokineospora soli TaxID=1048753 RepID=A0ABW2TXP3_9PSEU